jgi:hypothetical protein
MAIKFYYYTARFIKEIAKKMKPITKVDRKTTFSIPRLEKDPELFNDLLIPDPFDWIKIKRISNMEIKIWDIFIDNCMMFDYT